MTRLQRIRLNRLEERIARAIAVPLALLLSILFYLGRIGVGVLWRVRRILWKLSVTIAIVFFLTNVFGVIASAPKANATAPVIPAKTYTEHAEIISYIEKVFGKDAGKAIQVFTCESGLNPRAYNDNTSWGGVGHDYGVAQLNDHYQGVTNVSFLYDYKINILMAKQIFDRWGGNFHAWTCGRKLGL